MTAQIDKVAIRAMVDDYWRGFLAVARTSPDIGRKSAHDFNKRLELMAGLMPPEQAKQFLETVEEYRDELFSEYTANPDAQKRRLGLPADSVSPRTYRSRGGYQRQGMGEMVVRTAVRATIWEAIFSLFRAFR